MRYLNLSILLTLHRISRTSVLFLQPRSIFQEPQSAVLPTTENLMFHYHINFVISTRSLDMCSGKSVSFFPMKLSSLRVNQHNKVALQLCTRSYKIKKEKGQDHSRANVCCVSPKCITFLLFGSRVTLTLPRTITFFRRQPSSCCAIEFSPTVQQGFLEFSGENGMCWSVPNVKIN